MRIVTKKEGGTRVKSGNCLEWKCAREEPWKTEIKCRPDGFCVIEENPEKEMIGPEGLCFAVITMASQELYYCSISSAPKANLS